MGECMNAIEKFLVEHKTIGKGLNYFIYFGLTGLVDYMQQLITGGSLDQGWLILLTVGIGMAHNYLKHNNPLEKK